MKKRKYKGEDVGKLRKGEIFIVLSGSILVLLGERLTG